MPNFSLTRSIYGRKLADIRLIQARKLDYTDTYTRLENGWKALYIRGGSSMLRSRLLMSEYRFLALSPDSTADDESSWQLFMASRIEELPAFLLHQHNTTSLQGVKMPSTTTPLLPPSSQARLKLKSVVSSSFLYPFKGIYVSPSSCSPNDRVLTISFPKYFLANPSFYPLFGRRLIPLTILSILVLGTLFTWTYLPQAAFLLIFHGPTAWVSAVFLVLGEGQVIIALLFEAWMVDETMVDAFDVKSSPAK